MTLVTDNNNNIIRYLLRAYSVPDTLQHVLATVLKTTLFLFHR